MVPRWRGPEKAIAANLTKGVVNEVNYHNPSVPKPGVAISANAGSYLMLLGDEMKLLVAIMNWLFTPVQSYEMSEEEYVWWCIK